MLVLANNVSIDNIFTSVFKPCEVYGSEDNKVMGNLQMFGLVLSESRLWFCKSHAFIGIFRQA